FDVLVAGHGRKTPLGLKGFQQVGAKLHKSLAYRTSPVWTVCCVANARNSYGYCCALRLASHSKSGRALSRGLIQLRLRQNSLNMPILPTRDLQTPVNGGR